jgi:hypothetical protein
VQLLGSAVLVAIVSLLAGCASPPQPRSLAFLEASQVTEGDVVSQLGTASAVFPLDRVKTYRLIQKPNGYVVAYPPKSAPLGWQGIDYDLVLEFDAAGVLTQHNLVEIHPRNAVVAQQAHQ